MGYAAGGDRGDAEAYLSDLVTRDREDAGKRAALHPALDEGDASAVWDLTIDEIFEEALKRNLRAAN